MAWPAKPIATVSGCQSSRLGVVARMESVPPVCHSSISTGSTSIDASFLHQEGPASHMHIGAVLVFDGPPPAFERLPRSRPRAAAPRPALPAAAGDAAARIGPAAVGRRSELQPRVPRPPRGAARARAPRSSCSSSRRGSSPSSSTAPSRCGRAGWSRGSRTIASRSSSRPTIRSSTASRASISPRCCSTWHRRRHHPQPTLSPGSRSPNRRPRPARFSPASAARSAPPPSSSQKSSQRRHAASDARLRSLRDAAEGLGEIVWAGPQPGAGDPTQRRHSVRTGAMPSSGSSSRTTKRSRTRLGARSTMSC